MFIVFRKNHKDNDFSQWKGVYFNAGIWFERGLQMDMCEAMLIWYEDPEPTVIFSVHFCCSATWIIEFNPVYPDH